MKKLSFCVLLVSGALLAESATAQAQYGRRSGASSEPDWWVGVSYGFIQPGSVNDLGNSGSTWSFGYSSVTSAELAKSITGGTVGVLMNFATAPLTYSGPNVAQSLPSNCASQCSAHADITQIMLELKLGSRGLLAGLGLGGLHTIYGVDLGVTQYGNFRDSVSTTLPPNSSSWDPTFGFNFGLGWRFSQSFDSYAIEELSRVIHSQGSQIESSPPSIYTTRFGIRVGF